MAGYTGERTCLAPTTRQLADEDRARGTNKIRHLDQLLFYKKNGARLIDAVSRARLNAPFEQSALFIRTTVKFGITPGLLIYTNALQPADLGSSPD
jgi:hypothetical protein